MSLHSTLNFHRWDELCRRLGATDGDVIGRIFGDLVKRYAQDHRKYHTDAHIEHGLGELDRFPMPDQLHDLASRHLRDVVEFAFWFHDCVYDPHAAQGVNEEDSGYVACVAARNLMHSIGFLGLDDAVDRLIQLTGHQPVVGNPTQQLAEQLILDIDLSILGQDDAAFDAYEDGIRAEYAWVSAKEYRNARRDVLLQFLRRDRIYLTDFFFREYEDRARANLKRSVMRLLVFDSQK